MNNILREDISEKNLKEILTPYLRKWKLIFLFSILGFIFSFIFVKFIEPTYNVSAEVIVKEDENKASGLNAGSMLSELSFGITGMSNQVDNEIEIFKSKSLLLKVIKDLNLNIQIYENGNIQDKELFKNSPIKLNFINNQKEDYKNGSFDLTVIDNSTFELFDKKTKKQHLCKFGNTVNSSVGKFIVTPKNISKNNLSGKEFKIVINSNGLIIKKIKKTLKIERINKESNAIFLEYQTKNIDKGINILNSLIKQHSVFAINDKNIVANNTLKFIEERIHYLSKELTNVEQDVFSFKSNNKIFDLNTSAEIFFQNESETQKMILENETQLKLADYIYEFILKNKNNELLPSNLGITNPAIEQTIQTINSIQLEKNKLAFTSGDKNPIIANLDAQIYNLKKTLKETLYNQRKSLKITNRELLNRNNLLENKLKSAPKQEKDFKEIARQQHIKETLYLFLLQKKEETALALAITTSNTKIIDESSSDGLPIAPNKKLIYILSIFLGALIPITYIYINKLFNNKVQTSEDLSKLDLILIGNIPLVKSGFKIIVDKFDRTSLAEAFRLLRTNLNFVLNKNSEKSKTIFVTSTFSSEGKSFVSINLASTLAMTQKKVLLIGLDLRVPKLLEYINLNNNSVVGITNFIIDESIEIQSLIIQSTNLEGVDVISSGDIPPNPAELIMNNRMDLIFDYAKENYDYVIVDTAPVGLVTDTFLLKDLADITLYVVRANVLDKKDLPVLKGIYKNSKLKNISVLLNGVDYESGYGYGKGYGYGYGAQDELTRINKIKKFFKKQ
jgi:tyrosine-protein kinase Etk/Wzc